jgi:hypothetical protein
MWRNRLQNEYSGFDEFEGYSDLWDLSGRLGFASAREAWDANPLVQGSTNPADYMVVEQFVLHRNTKDRMDHEKEAEVIDAMYEAEEILEHSDFLVQVADFDGFAKTLGYGPDLPLADDWHVGYHKSTYGGLPCLYMTHSECDFIFLRPADAKMLQEAFAQDMTPLEWKRHTQHGDSVVDPR